MTDPFGFVPLAAAVAARNINGALNVRQVAAGYAILQQSAGLVRALVGRRSAILLPPSLNYLTALAASTGRGAVLVNPRASREEVERQLADSNVGAAFTTRALGEKLPGDLPRVYLDESPQRAVVDIAGVETALSLEGHLGLSVEGDPETPGADDEALVICQPSSATAPALRSITHRNLLTAVRSALHVTGISGDDHVLAAVPFSDLAGLVLGLVPVFAGSTLACLEPADAGMASDVLELSTTSVLIGTPVLFSSLVAERRRRGASLRHDRLRLCIATGVSIDTALRAQWFDLTGVELRQGYRIDETFRLVEPTAATPR